jgi:hypothetical protein
MIVIALTLVCVRRAARRSAEIVSRLSSATDGIVEIISSLRCLFEKPIETALGRIIALQAEQLVPGWLEADTGWRRVSESTVFRFGLHNGDRQLVTILGGY